MTCATSEPLLLSLCLYNTGFADVSAWATNSYVLECHGAHVQQRSDVMSIMLLSTFNGLSQHAL